MTENVFNKQFSEIAALSLILKNPALLDKIPELKPRVFSTIVHNNIMKTILEIRSNGLIPDYSLLISHLNNKNILESCGGEEYIKYIINQKFEESNAYEFVNHIINSYKARELLALISKVPSMVVDESSVDTAISWLRNNLDGISTGIDSSMLDFSSASKLAWEHLVERVNNPNKIQYSTNFSNIDYIVGGYIPGDLWIIAGRPGMGKSAYMCNSVLSGVPSLVFSLEMNRDALINRIISMKSGVPIISFRLGTLTQTQLDKVAETIAELDELPIYIDSLFSANINYIVSKIRRYHSQQGVQVVHIDYVQLLAKRDADATHILGAISRELKLLANELGITIVIYSQLNRGVEQRDDKRPLLSDLRQSGNLEEDSDIDAMLFRDVMYNQDTKNPKDLEFIIRKHRNGPIGTLFLEFLEDTNLMVVK